MLVRLIAIDVLAGVLLAVAWYFWFARYNRRKAVEILHWVERAFGGHGEIESVHWTTASRFQVQMRLAPAVFHHASLRVQLFPRELPFSWLVSRTRGRRETLTFEADLDGPPSFNL